MLVAVLASAALHALWNFLLRRAGGSTVVLALSKVAEVVCLLPLAVWTWRSSGTPMPAGYLPVVLVATMLALGNYLALAGAYRRAELSLVYPVARGAVFFFLPVMGLVVLSERIGAIGWTSLVFIVLGIAMLPLEAFTVDAARKVSAHLRSRAIGLALLAALCTAGYTTWDKIAVGFLDPFLYFCGYTVLLAAWFGVTLLRTPRDEVRAAWRRYPVSIVSIGLLNAFAYLLILAALRTGMPTQVLAVRQLSIPIGVVLGWQLLRERLTPARAIGAVLVTTGCALAALI